MVAVAVISPALLNIRRAARVMRRSFSNTYRRAKAKVKSFSAADRGDARGLLSLRARCRSVRFPKAEAAGQALACPLMPARKERYARIRHDRSDCPLRRNDMQEFATTVAGFPLRLRCARMGDDFCLILSGGAREHIGAAAVAQPRPSLADPALTSATASVITLLGHQEDILVRALSLKVAATLNAAACVVCGIRMPHPTPALLEETIAASHRLVDDFLAAMRAATES